MIPLNGSGFDSYVVLNSLPKWWSVVNLVEDGAGIVSLKTFNGCFDQNKNILQYFHFICGRVHNNSSLKKSISYQLEPLV